MCSWRICAETATPAPPKHASKGFCPPHPHGFLWYDDVALHGWVECWIGLDRIGSDRMGCSGLGLDWVGLVDSTCAFLHIALGPTAGPGPRGTYAGPRDLRRPTLESNRIKRRVRVGTMSESAVRYFEYQVLYQVLCDLVRRKFTSVHYDLECRTFHLY